MHHLRRIATATALLPVVALGLLISTGSANAVPANCTASTRAYGGTLRYQLAPGQFCLSSPDRRHYVVFQGDGNLVLYSTIGGTHATWASDTAGRGKYLVPQADGNLVVYTVGYLGNLQAIWASYSTQAPNSRYALDMQNDGNFVIYNEGPSGPGINQALWSTRTSGR